MVTHQEVVEARALPRNTSAQKAELIGLCRALIHRKDKIVNIYTDSRYGFLTLHAHGARYKERGLITAGGKDIKNGEEILALLAAVWLPKQVAVMHCRGHQKGDNPIARGNHYVDEMARWAVLHGPWHQPEITTPLTQVSLKDFVPQYSRKEEQQATKVFKAKEHQGWWILPDGRPFVPRACAWELVQQTHEATHLGRGTGYPDSVQHVR